MPHSTTSTHLSPAELSYLHTSLSSHPPIRPDSRAPTDFRPMNAETSVLPNTMGSAHVGFVDGREAVVGVRAEVEKSLPQHSKSPDEERSGDGRGTGEDVEMGNSEGQSKDKRKSRGKADWVTLGLTLPGMRDDDKDLVFLEEMLRETLVTTSTMTSHFQSQHQSQSLQDSLVINSRWHWRLYIDVLLISAPDQSSSSPSSSTTSSGSATYPLPLLSIAIHLALRDTRLPRLKSEGEEDPVADDDWDASIHLYPNPLRTKHFQNDNHHHQHQLPPVTLLVMTVGDNVLFDPSTTELAVADGVFAISIGLSLPLSSNNESNKNDDDDSKEGQIKILALRALETPARDTMKGVPRDEITPSTGEDDQDRHTSGVWRPKVGGVKRSVLKTVVDAVLSSPSPSLTAGGGGGGGGVGRDVLTGLNGFFVGAV